MGLADSPYFDDRQCQCILITHTYTLPISFSDPSWIPGKETQFISKEQTCPLPKAIISQWCLSYIQLG